MLTSGRVRTSDRPPKAAGYAFGAPVRAPGLFVRVTLGAALLSGLLFVAGAWGVTGNRPRTDPGDPPVPNGGMTEGWWLQTIPGLPAESRLGDVWVSSSGIVYVWAVHPGPARPVGSAFGEAAEGERLPNGDPRTDPVSSSLYRFDGVHWSAVLQIESETGVALYGTDDANLYASTTGAAGDARLYRFDGRVWRAETVPGYHLGRLHTMAGVRGDLYFRIDRVLMRDRDDGRGLQPVFEEAGEHQPVRGLVYLGPEHVMMLETDGYAFYHSGVWSERASAPFSDVQDAWGARDASGQLKVYALGSSAAGNGLRVWRFEEDDPVSHAGTWRCVLADPALSTTVCTGSGLHVWGSGGDVYATALVDEQVRLLHRDANGWSTLTPPVPPCGVHGVWGSAQGPVWFSLGEGRMLRYVPPAAAESAPAPIAVTRPAGAALVLRAVTAPGAVRIRFELPQAGAVEVTAYDATGRWCATVDHQFRARGAHELTWAQGGLRSGVYFIRIRSGGLMTSQRVVLMR
ncbi:MAG: hypothetical protein ABL977_11925 [Candidatus Eisenbacteria bacterium]